MGAAGLAVSLAVTLAGTAASVASQRTSAREQEDAQKIGQRQAAIENKRRIRQAIAASRADRAATIAAGQAQQGGFGSSVLRGAIGAADTQLASNIGFARQTQAFNQAINQRLQASSRAQTRAGIFSAVAGLPGQFGVAPGDIISRGLS